MLPRSSYCTVLVPLVCSIVASEALAGEVAPGDDEQAEFDEAMLKERGIDPRLATYFRDAPRYTGGTHSVTLSVNGRSLGRVPARFGVNGDLCVDRPLLDAADIVAPRKAPMRSDGFVAEGAGESCIDLVAAYPQTAIELTPGKAEVSLVVPTHALRERREDVSGYDSGGVAGLFNYEMIGVHSRFDRGSSRFWSANTEAGFNAGDWIVRSRQVYTSSDGQWRATRLDAYAQRSFAKQRAVLQIGELSLFNPVLAGAQVVGVQVGTEQALASSGPGRTIEGIARSQARVEVRQNGILIHSAVVPAGPFVLRGVTRVNGRSDIEVTVVEADGAPHRFVVPAASVSISLPSAGYTLAAGKVRNAGNTARAPWVLNAGWSGPAARGSVLSGGALFAQGYEALGAGWATPAWSGALVQGFVQASRTRRTRRRGMQASVSLSQRVGERWSVQASATQQTVGYRDLIEAVQRANTLTAGARYKNQYAGNLSWSHPRLGSVGGGITRTVQVSRTATSRGFASWNTRVGTASVSLTAEWSLGGGGRSRDNSLYLNISVPLGESRHLGASIRERRGEVRTGVGINGRVDDRVTYRAGAERGQRSGQTDFTGGVSLLPRYTQVDLGYARYGNGDTLSMGMSGGVAIHAHGVTLSPFPLRDTFGVLALSGMPGIKVSTPSGPVWSDSRGYAVLPQLTPFGRSAIEVDTRSLPRNVDIGNGSAVVRVGRGAVRTIDFRVARTRRILLETRLPDGRPLREGAIVSDGDEALVSLVQSAGQVFVPNALGKPRLWVEEPGQPRCELDYALPEQPDPDVYFEVTSAVCR